jgi:hypothetical protein
MKVRFIKDTILNHAVTFVGPSGIPKVKQDPIRFSTGSLYPIFDVTPSPKLSGTFDLQFVDPNINIVYGVHPEYIEIIEQSGPSYYSPTCCT